MNGKIVRAAARGELPPWAVVAPKRRAHIARVAALMDQWARAAGLHPEDRDRWVAAAWLHDALRDAGPERLRSEVPDALRGLPGPLLHGPAAAERLEGEADDELRDAVRYHTLGHPSFGSLGKALYLADFLEPGRDFEIEWRAELRRRLPEALDAAAVEVVAARIRYLVEGRKPVRPETAAFWSALVGPDRP
jgi:HD superfamily phosphohydrolase YqeK